MNQLTSQSLWKAIGIAAIRILAVTYIILIVALVCFQRRLMYFPSHNDLDARGRPPFVPWLSAEGKFLGYAREGANIKRVAVLFHGNGGEALDRSWLNDLLPSSDVALVLPEYPGYGAKPGEPSQEAIESDGIRLLDEVRKRWNGPITLIGESLGTGVACALASQSGIERVALISPFSSAIDVARSRFPFLPLQFLIRDKFLSDQNLSKVTLPLFVVHGTEDDTIPVESGKRLFNGYNGKVKFFAAMRGYSHNNVLPWILNSPDGEEFRLFVRNP